MPNLTLSDGTKIPVTREYAVDFSRLSREQQIAEGKRLKEQQAPAPAVDGSQAQAAPQQPQQPVSEIQTKPGVLEDVTRSIGSGFRTGIESIGGTPQDLISLGAAGVNKLFGTEYTGDVPGLPSSEDIHEFTTPVFGQSYEPQTTAGKFARTATEFGAGSILPGGLAKNALHAGIGAVAGLASEGAGQATEGTRLEPWARGVTGLVAGTGLEAGRSGVSHLRAEPGRKIERAAEDAAAKHGVKLTKGERTGDVSQQMKEQQMLHGAKGGWAQRLMEQRRRENLEGVKDASGKIQDTAAPSRGSSPADSAANLNWSARRRIQQLKEEGGAKIDQALNEDVWVDGHYVQSFPGYISQRLQGDIKGVPDIVLSPNTPIANEAKARIETFMKENAVDLQGEISLAGIEHLRRRISKLQGKDPEDARALGKIKQYFDEWYDTLLDKGVTRIGDTPIGDGATPQIGTPPAKSGKEVLADLKEGRKQYSEGVQVERPRKGTVGGQEVAKVVSEGQHPEDTARLFKPNDRGDLSPAANDAIDRLVGTGATSAELDQVRGIVLDQLMNGDPGKVASRIDNFMRNNPTAANTLFDREQLASIKAWGDTNKRLVVDPKAANPSKSSYGVIGEMGKQAARQMTTGGGVLGTLLGGPIGTVLGAGAGLAASGLKELGSVGQAREALQKVSRDTLAQAMTKGGAGGARAATQGATQGAQTLTITDEADPDFGTQVKIISEGKSGYKVRLPNGKEKLIGKELVR